MMYGSDYNDTIVPAMAPTDTDTKPKWAQPNYWTALLSPYVGGKQTSWQDGIGFNNMNELKLAICPTVPTRFGYGHNAWFLSIKATSGAAVGSNNNNKYLKYGKFRNASSVVFLADNQLDCSKDYDYNSKPENWNELLLCGGYGFAAWWPTLDFRHNLSANILWLDGHVSPMHKNTGIINGTNCNETYWGKL